MRRKYLSDAFEPLLAQLEGRVVPAQMDVAEKLDGTIKHHVVYARRKDGNAPGVATGASRDIPNLRGIKPGALAQKVAKDQAISITLFGTPYKIPVPKEAAPIIAAMDFCTRWWRV